MQKLNKEMTEMVGQARDVMFLATLIEPKESPCHYVTTTNCGLTVMLSISGMQRTLGRGFIDEEMASRFADMASLRFRRYRKQLRWNYSEAQAVADSANAEENGGELANFLLARLHNELAPSLKPYVTANSSAIRRITRFELLKVESRLSLLESELGIATLKIASLQDKVFLLEGDASRAPVSADQPPTLWKI